MSNNGTAGRGRGGGRGGGRGRQYGREKKRAHADPASPAADMADEDVRVNVPNAFRRSFPNLNRVRERGRLFTLGGQPFAVVERTIGGMDDPIYSKHRDVWEHLSRGNARVFVQDGSSSNHGGYRQLASLNGLRKFGYNDSSYGYPDKVVSCIAIEKENGECGHLAAFTHGGQRYWFLGSKNVHIVLRYEMPEEDFALYSGRRYGYALRIARLWRTMLQSTSGSVGTHAVSADHAAEFHRLLSENGWTSCFEAIFADSQHLVDYHQANELRFYALTRDNDEGSEKGLCVPVEEAEKVYQSVGLYFSHHSPITEYKSAAYDALIDDIGRRRNSEGCVMYGYSADGTVVRLWKEKSYPYVMERAAREAITTNKLAGAALVARLKKKLAMQRSDLRHYFQEWEQERLPWLVRFGAFLQVRKKLTPSTSHDQLFDVRNQWLSLQHEFQQALDNDPEVSAVCDAYEPDAVEWGEPTELDVVKFVGAQGCGKSTIARALFVLLSRAGFTPRWVNQDEEGSRDKFLAAIRQSSSDSSGVTHLLIDKMNLDARTNADYKQLPLTLTVTWHHSDGTQAMIDECFQRVIGRGAGHRTIRLADNLTESEKKQEMEKIRGFMSKAIRSWQVPEDDSVLDLDITDDLSTMVKGVWEQLQVAGIHPLPMLTDAQVESALNLSRRYEQLLALQAKAPLYAAAQVVEPAALLALIPEGTVPSAQKVQQEFHVTLKYFVGNPDPIFLVDVAERQGELVSLVLERLVHNAKGTAIVVRKPSRPAEDSTEGGNPEMKKTGDASNYFPCANPVAHITIANAPGVRPVYSNTLVADDYDESKEGPRTVHEFPQGTTVQARLLFR